MDSDAIYREAVAVLNLFMNKVISKLEVYFRFQWRLKRSNWSNGVVKDNL